MNPGNGESDGRPLDPRRRRSLQLISAAVAAANVAAPAMAFGAESQPSSPAAAPAEGVDPQAVLVARRHGQNGQAGSRTSCVRAILFEASRATSRRRALNSPAWNGSLPT